MSLAEQDTKSYNETVSFSSKVFPIGGLVVALSTLALCLVTNRWNQRDNGGMYWPYISDLAREPPKSSLFAFGLWHLADSDLGLAHRNAHRNALHSSFDYSSFDYRLISHTLILSSLTWILC